MAKRGKLVQLHDNKGYEDIPIGAVGIVLEWTASVAKPSRGGLYVVLFPTERIGKETRTMFADRFKIVGEVLDG